MKPQSILFGIFSSIGTICFLICLYFTYQSIHKISTWEETSGTITQLNNSGYPTISFQYNGVAHEFRENFSSSDMYSGQAVKVHFPPGEPNKAELKSFFALWFAILLLGIFFVVFGSIGFIGLWWTWKPSRLRQELVVMGKGRKISVPIGEITQNFSFKVNGRSPFIIVGQWHDKSSNTIYQFKSEYIWYNPALYLEGKKEVDVYIDPNDMKKYYLDISFLPKKG